MPIRIPLTLLCAVAILSAGCGRRGALEAPGQDEALLAPSAPAGVIAPIEPNAAAAGELSTLDPGSPGSQEPPRDAAAPARAERPFVLDPLL